MTSKTQTAGGTPRDSDSGLRQRRPSTSTTERFLQTAKQAEQRVERALLVLWDDLPAWRQDNHFIQSGYRPTSNSYWGSFTSLFYVHNEFVNIWTHLIGAAVFPLIGIWLYNVIVPRYASASSSDVLVFSFFFGGALSCLGMSATFHSIMNHSEDVAKWGNKLDYSGIVFLIVGSYVPALYYGLFCLPNLLTVYMYGVSCQQHNPITPMRHYKVLTQSRSSFSALAAVLFPGSIGFENRHGGFTALPCSWASASLG